MLASRELPHLEHAGHDSVLVVLSLRHLVAGVSAEEAEVDRVRAWPEVRLQLELEVVHDDVTGMPQVHRVLAVEDIVIAVVPALVAVDVNERLPVAGDR